MFDSIIKSLGKFWDVEHQPKHSLHPAKDEYLIDIKTANVFYIIITISILTVTVLFIGGGML